MAAESGQLAEALHSFCRYLPIFAKMKSKNS